MSNSQKARPGQGRRALVVFLALVVVAGLALAFGLQAAAETESAAQAEAEATITFNHRKHVAADVPCLFCHPGAINGPVASIPSVQKCVGCHQNIEVISESGQATVSTVLQMWAEGRPLEWPSIVDLPDFVYFNHRPHLAAGRNCEYCHGDVSQMTMARSAYRINMGFCLENCHRHQDPEKRERLMDCATCHQ
jgi:hypothetical protein